MKSAILLHGTAGSDTKYFWFGDIKNFLESHGYDVWWPQLPHTEKPELQETLNFVQKNMPPIDEQTIFIGHSSACPLILSLLEHISSPIKQVVLVAGFYQPLNDDGYSDLMLPKSFNWDKIKIKAKEFILINSDNDPWGCDDKQARPVAERIAAKFVLAKGQGHMGSTSFNQAYNEFPLLKGLLRV